MTQQPNQNYPQPGQGWGQQGQQPQQWGQQPPQQQWGQQAPAAPAYGQPTQQWGGQSGYGSVAPTSTSGDGVVGKAWALYASIGAAVVALITLFLSWGGLSVTVDVAGKSQTAKTMITAFSVKTTYGGKTVSNPDGSHPTRIWGILIVLGAIVLIVGAVLALTKKTKLFGWIQTGGAVVIVGAVIGEIIYLNGKLSDGKKELSSGAFPDGSKYEIGLQFVTWIAVAAAVAAIAFSVLTALSISDGSGSASGGYAVNYGQGAYGQPAQAAYGQQPAAQQWGQPQAQPQQQAWGQQDAQPQGQQWGQQQPNPFDPANQPTQAVQQQYPPQPPQ
jgi:hypothetical protein